jgi:hypothetical protein
MFFFNARDLGAQGLQRSGAEFLGNRLVELEHIPPDQEINTD